MQLSRRAMLALSGATLLAGAGGATRSYRLGTTRWPPAATFEGLALAEAFLRDTCDMAAPMVLGGVPWLAALAGDPFSQTLMDELNWKAAPGHPVCLSLGALDTLRQGLAPFYADKDNQPLPAEFADLAFDDPKVIAAYSAFCLRSAQIMQPDWLIIGVEVNLLMNQRPDLWLAYLRLHHACVAHLREHMPRQKIGFSIAALHYLGLLDNADAALQKREMLALADSVDIIGWSVYPHTSWDVPLPLAADFFDFISDFALVSGKPVAITKSGMSSQRVWIGLIPLGGSPEKQAQVMTVMLAAAQAGGWQFVVNWTSHDYPELLEIFPPETRELGEIWVWTGLVGPKGEAKPVTAVWKEALDLRYQRPD